MSQKLQNVSRSILGEADKFGTHSFNKRYLKESETHWHQTAAWPLPYACTQPYHLGVTTMNSCFTLHKGLSVSHYSHQTLYDQRHVQGLSTQHTWEPLAGNCMAVYCPTACTRKVLCGADVAMRRNPAKELVNCKPVLVFDCSKFLTLFTGTWPAINQILKKVENPNIKLNLEVQVQFIFSFVLHSLSHYHTIKSNKKINKG